jgi:hypothetical protein
MEHNNSMEINDNHGGTDPQSFYLAIVCVLINIFGHFLSKIEHSHIPEIVMQLFQIGAWCSAIGVFIVTIFKNKNPKS